MEDRRKDFDPNKAIEELGKTAQLEFRIGSDTDENGKPTGKLVLTGKEVDTATAMYQQSDTGATEPVVQPAEKRRPAGFLGGYETAIRKQGHNLDLT